MISTLRFCKRPRVAACVLAGLLTAGTRATAATFYCDPAAGSPQGDGSAARPWGSLEEALRANRIQMKDAQGQLRNPDAPVRAGDTLLLRSGWHGFIRIATGYHARPVTLAADEGHAPQVGSLEVREGANWTFRGLTVSPSLAPVPPERPPAYLVSLGEHGSDAASSNLVVESCFVYSVLDTSGWSAQDWLRKPAGGIFLGRHGRAHVARNNYLLNLRFGISLCAPGCVAEGNVVENFSADGIRATRSGQTVRHNVIRNIFVSAADGDDNHDDGIQVFPFNRMKEAVRDVAICDNLISACEDDALPFRAPMQGIGCFDGPLVGFRVSGNVVCANTWHGLSLYDAQGCAISNNVVYSRWTNREQPWLMLGAKQKLARGNTVRDNWAKNGFHLKADAEAQAAGNGAATEALYRLRRDELARQISDRFGATHPAARRPRL